VSRVSTYLNFMGQTEQAMAFYGHVFGTELLTPLMRFGDLPGAAVAPEEAHLVLHAELEILAGHVIMATDMLASAGHQLRIGNNVTINLECDTRAQTEVLYGALSQGATDATGLADMPWGSYWGTCLDRFGVRWMFNCSHGSA